MIIPWKNLSDQADQRFLDLRGEPDLIRESAPGLGSQGRISRQSSLELGRTGRTGRFLEPFPAELEELTDSLLGVRNAFSSRL